MSPRVTRETIYGKVIYPDVLPRARKHKAEVTLLLLTILVYIMCVQVANFWSFFSVLVYFALLRVVCEFLKKLSYILEEKDHLASRYHSNYWYLLKGLFTRKYWCCVVVIIATFFILPEENIIEYLRVPLCGAYVIVEFITSFLKLDRCPVYDSMILECLQPLDYGSGMAFNFFYGYLRLVLPNTGTQEKGIREKIDDFIGRQHLDDSSFPVKKLFILIPSSTYVPNDLKEKSYEWMENAGTLEVQVKDRAGVIGRMYKNSVYRIKDPDSVSPPVYVVAEGATPLKTFHEVVQFSGKRQEFFVSCRKEIIFMFYERLREVLRDHPDCKDHCELVYYVDTDEQGLDNVNIAKIILQRIDEIKENEAQLKHLRDAD